MAAPKRPPPPVEGGYRVGTNVPVVVVSGQIGTPQIESLCARVQELFRAEGHDTVLVDVRGVVDPDIAALDALARLHLTARRMGRRIRVLHTCEQLEELVALAGLRDVLCLKDEGKSE